MVQPEPSVIATEQPVPHPSPLPERENATSNSHGGRRRSQGRDKTKLKRDLPAWQILMIAIGGVIGVTIFSTSGEIIHTAGPAGLFTAMCFVCITTICVMECIAEMVVLWPVSNAMIEFVKVFVDHDLAIVIGITYWYTMSSVFALLIVAASDFASFWLTDDTWRNRLFFAVIPFCLLIINCLGVKVYGWIEGVGGAVKLLLIAVGVIFMIVDAPKVGNENIDAGFHYNSDEASNKFVAVCLCIPLLAYGFIGTEIVSVTAFEAQDRKSLRFPVRWVAYIICSVYLISAVLEMVVIGYNNCNLPDLNGDSATGASSDDCIAQQRIWVRLEVTSEALFEVTNYLEQNAGIPLVPLAPVEMVQVNV